MVALRSLSQGVPVGAATMTQFATLTPESRIDEAIELLLRTSQSEFPIVDHAQRPVSILSRADLIRVPKELGPEARVIAGAMPPGYRLGSGHRPAAA
jgi:stage IV sporulation protein FB